MKKIAATVAVALLPLALAAPPAQASAPTEVTASVPTAKKDYPKKKRNRFWRTVKKVDPFVKYAGKKSTVELGVATCDLLRAGGDLFDLSLLVLEADAGPAEDSIIAVIATAPVVLCPDQAYKFE